MLALREFRSRVYRAPEIVLGAGFNTQLDMWGFGILLTHLYTGKVPFCVHALTSLIETFGEFPPEMLNNATNSINRERYRSKIEHLCNLLL